MVAVVLVLAGFFSIVFGIVITASQPRRAISWLFLLTMIAVAIWEVGVAAFLSLDDAGDLAPIVQAYYIAAAFIAPCMLLTITTLAAKQGRRQYLLAFLPTLIIVAAIMIAPKLLIQAIVIGAPNEVQLNMPFYLIYVFYFSLYYLIALGYALYVVERKNYQPLRRKQVRSVAYAYGISGLVGMIFNLFLPAFGDYSLIWVGPLCLFIFVPMVYYAIAKHRLFDLKLAIVRTIAYVFSLSVLALVYFGLAYLISLLFFKNVSSSEFNVSPLNVILALVLAFIFQPIKQFFDRVTNRIFYRDRYNTDDLIADVGAIITSTDDLMQLLETTARTIGQTIKASGASFVVYREDKSPLQVGMKGHVYLTTSEIDDLRSYIDEHGDTIINVDEQVEKTSRRPAIITALSRRRVALVVPLVERQGSIGFLLIDEQMGSGYVKHDIKALETLTDELVVAVENAISLQEVRDINTHLEQRINAATKQLRRSNNELKALDETKDEFISMASHQLRTPLTSIKGYISMVLDGDVGDINEAQRKLLGEAFASSERMVHLIGDFLNVSRLQTGKFIIDQKPTNLAQVVAEEVESIGSLVTSHDMTLVYKPPKNIPIIQMDEDKIRQVIMNFIDNAVYYSHAKSTIVVKLVRRGEYVELEVHDHGIGVPAEAQKRLFSKFFRAGNARRQRPDGTGIGLFLAKKVVTAQGGEIIFESYEGKGSVFGFRLPIHPKTPRTNDGE